MESNKIPETPLNLEDFRLVFIVEKGEGFLLAKNFLGTNRHPDSGKTNQGDTHQI